MKKPSLIILAAGMGSRYGGLKQLDQFGPNGESIIDYSIYDAIQAGFGKIIFVVRESFNEKFRSIFEPKLQDKIKTVYVNQELDQLPEGFSLPKGRTKPWGTAHAVLAARHVVNEAFAVINADDYYGVQAYQSLYKFLTTEIEAEGNHYCMVGYRLGNTLSEHGSVSRGICLAKEGQGYLEHIVETHQIKRDENGRITHQPNELDFELRDDTIVSMNIWGASPELMRQSEEYFRTFLEKHIHEEKSEFYIPLVIASLIKEKKATVKILSSDAQWFGVTFAPDKIHVQSKITKLIKDGIYPEKLWTDNSHCG